MLQNILTARINPSAIYSRENRKRFLTAAALSVVAIALIDSVTPNVPLGFLYLFPILLIAGFVSRKVLVLVALVCGFLAGEYSDYRFGEALSFSVMAFLGFTGTGFLVSEIIRSRQLVVEHEEELRGLIESSPVAIITIDPSGHIRLANGAAQNLFAPGDAAITGQSIVAFVPSLLTAAQQNRSATFRTELRCQGKRKNGETFPAGIWFSTSGPAHNPFLAAIVVDLSQDLRDREDLNLEHLITNAKILLGAMSHEIRNVCGAVMVTYENLSRLTGLSKNEDFRILGTLVEGLRTLSGMELRSSDEPLASVDLASVLNELRIIIEPAFQESSIRIQWCVDGGHPRVAADPHGLLQVFLNLAKNSQRAMEQTERRQLKVSASVGPSSVVVRFEDSGTGVAHPENLFRAFQNDAASTGLGLYVSRAILKSFGGEIRYEPRPEGCCFAVALQRFPLEEAQNA
jgi:PAS domain S-box-containing protein